MLKPLFHLSVAVVNSYVLWYDQKYIDLPFPNEAIGTMPLKGRSVFLTMWCLVLQTVYHFVAFLCDFIEEKSTKKRPMPYKIKDLLFSVAFPLAIYVTVAFWSIYIVDRELIFPESFDKVFPPLFNHVMHTTVAVFIVIELVTSYREYPTRSIGLTFFMSIISTYTFWTFYIFFTCNAWIYPVFDHFNWPQRILFISFSFAIGAYFYIAGERINRLVCPKKQKNIITNGKSKTS